MKFLDRLAAPLKAAAGTTPIAKPSTKRVGDGGEDRALAHLQAAGMRLVARNFKTPGRGGGEIDLVVRAADGTLVFVEVRKRRTSSHGGAAGSVTTAKQRRIVFAARHFLLRYATPPACRFDVISIEADRIEWLRAAFDASA